MRTRGHRHRAYEHLRTRILRLALPPGVTISENELAAELGMSRTPVREAIMLLTDEGLVEVLPQVDRKSTRLNSSHVAISYAVFCLKKKNYNAFAEPTEYLAA